MSRRTKRDLPAPVTQKVLAENVAILRDDVFRHLDTATRRNQELAKRANTSLSQVQRVTAASSAIGIDTVERLALALDVRPQDLLTPNFARRHIEAEPV